MKDNKPIDKQREVLKDVYESSRKDDAEVLIQALGIDLVNRFFMLYRTGKVHSIENEATQKAISAVIHVIEKLSEISSRISLMVVGDTFYINKTMLKTDFSSFENFRFLGELFKSHSFSGIAFNSLPDKKEFESFLSAFLKSSPDETSKAWIGNYSSAAINVLTGKDLEEVEGRVVTRDDLSDPGFLLRQYFKTVMGYKLVSQSFQSGDVTTLNVLQRLVHEYVDAMHLSVKSLLMLVNIHSPKDYIPVHSTNTMILSLIMGKELELSRKQMSDLGSAALLHDIGKMRIPRGILEKEGKLLKHEWDQLNQARTYSVLELLKLKGFNESSLCRLLVAHENASGLDPESRERQPTLMSRIVSIACCYDAMVTTRSYRSAILPDEALKIMKQQEGTKFDGALLEVFINMLTEYPPGTLILLNTKEVGVVTDTQKERANPRKPQVLIIYDQGGKKIEGAKIDLGKDTRRSIERTLDPHRYGINVIPFLFPEQRNLS